MRVLQRFECCIVDVDDGDVTVEMTDLTHNNPDEQAVIGKERFTLKQQPLLQLGYVFLWEITTYRGLVSSTFTFKPLEVFTQDQIDSAAIKAKTLYETLNPEPLGEPFNRLLQENSWDLYES